MNPSYLTELALRKALMDVNSVENPLSALQSSAIKHAAMLVRGKFDASRQHHEMNVQENALTSAIRVLKDAWKAINEQLKLLGRDRVDFDRERVSGIATFLIPSTKETRDLAKEQAAMRQFFTLVSKDKRIFSYLGLHSQIVNNKKKKIEGQFLSVLPYYIMSNTLSDPLVTSNPSDRARHQIRLFFKTQVPKYLRFIENLFINAWRITDYIQSRWQGDNYLNNYRGPRLIIMCLGNLLWHLQHPIDLNTGLLLSLDEKLSLCRKVSVFVNRLLDKKTPPSLYDFDSEGELVNFVRQVEIYVNDLKHAFEEEKLQALNISDVSNSAHKTAGILDENIFKLIYGKKLMASHLASTVNYLSLLLKRDKSILTVIEPYNTSVKLVNRPPSTVIDLLLIFLHLSDWQKSSLIDKLKLGSTTSKCMALTLKSFNKEFFKPIYTACERAVSDGRLDNADLSVTQLAAARLLPLIGLAVDDYRIDLSDETSPYRETQSNKHQRKYFSGAEQLAEITRLAYHSDKEMFPAYSWDLTSFVDLGVCLTKKMNELPKRQYKIGQFTTLLDLLQSFITQYRSLLKNKQFKLFIVNSLENIGTEFHLLGDLLSELETDINADTTDDRHLIDTVKTLDQSLQLEIARFKTEVNSLSDRMSNPLFEKLIQKEVIQKLNRIDSQFHLAFGHSEPGLRAFIDRLQTEYDKDSMPLKPIDKPKALTGEVARLSALVMSCYHNLSYSSKHDRKGFMLLDLQKRIESKPSLNDDDLTEISLELSRIVCAYRPGFFQSTYAHTKSSDVLIKAIIESFHDKRFPLAKRLFGSELFIKGRVAMSAQQFVQEELNHLRQRRFWAESSEYLAQSQLFNA